MPSIPIQNITDLNGTSVTGEEEVPLVKQIGSAFFTYKLPINSFFYKNAIPFSALSACTLKWTRNGPLSAVGSVIVDGNIGVGAKTPSAKLHVVGVAGDTSPDLRIGTGLGTTNGSVDFYNSLPDNAYNGITNLGDNAIIYGRDAANTATGFVIAPWRSGTSGIRIAGTGNVGIGTSEPTSTLDVGGTITLSQNSNSIRFTDTSGSYPRLSMQSDNNFVFYGTNSTGGLRAVYSIIQRSNTSNFSFAVPVTMASSLQLNRNQLLRWGANYESTDDANITVTQDGVDSTRMRFRIGDVTTTRDSFVFERGNRSGGSGTPLATIRADGRVGINTTEPDTTLDIRGQARITNNASTLQLVGTNHSYVEWFPDGIASGRKAYMGFPNSGANYFEIHNQSGTNIGDIILTPSANSGVGIGTTSPSTYLHVGPNTSGGIPSGWGGGIHAWDIYANGTMACGTNGSIRSYLNKDGYVGGVAFNSTSSKRFKDNITPLESTLTNVQKLSGVRYNWKDTGKADIGLIAEEVDKIYPELVKKDEEGIPEGIDYGKLTAVLIETVKELSQKIEELERKVK